jgi:hypothetical protein
MFRVVPAQRSTARRHHPGDAVPDKKAKFVLDSVAIASPPEMSGRRELRLVSACPVFARAAHH